MILSIGDEIFVDTSGFYALPVGADDQHRKARWILREAAEQRRSFITTEYVIDETLTLLKARGHRQQIKPFTNIVLNSKACRIESVGCARFTATIAFFLKRLDQDWSFTNCASFQLMSELRLREALTKDAHFLAAGFTVLLS